MADDRRPAASARSNAGRRRATAARAARRPVRARPPPARRRAPTRRGSARPPTCPASGAARRRTTTTTPSTSGMAASREHPVGRGPCRGAVDDERHRARRWLAAAPSRSPARPRRRGLRVPCGPAPRATSASASIRASPSSSRVTRASGVFSASVRTAPADPAVDGADAGSQPPSTSSSRSSPSSSSTTRGAGPTSPSRHPRRTSSGSVMARRVVLRHRSSAATGTRPEVRHRRLGGGRPAPA